MAKRMTKRQIIAKERASALKAWTKFLRDNHHDWDFAYLLRTIAFKLHRMRLCLKHGVHARSREVHDEILEVEALLKRVLDHNYHREAFKDFRAAHGRMTTKMVPIEKDGKVVGHQCDFLYGGKRPTPAMDREIRRLHRRTEKAEVDDLRRAFRLMAERLQGWWD